MEFLSPGPPAGAQSAGLAGAWQPPPQEAGSRRGGHLRGRLGQLLPPQPRMAPGSQPRERGSARCPCGPGRRPAARRFLARDWLQVVLRLLLDAPVGIPSHPPCRHGRPVSLLWSWTHTSHYLAQPPEKHGESTQYSGSPLCRRLGSGRKQEPHASRGNGDRGQRYTNSTSPSRCMSGGRLPAVAGPLSWEAPCLQGGQARCWGWEPALPFQKEFCVSLMCCFKPKTRMSSRAGRIWG